MAELNNPEAAATDVWREVFAGGPYTSFKMVEIVAGLLGMSYSDILANPAQLNGFNPDFVTEANITEAPLLSTWSSLTGRCTSFAANVATLLEARYPGVFNFQYYDVGRHRVAHCESTGILIDSSSAVGPVVLRENQEWTNLNGVSGRWKYINGMSTYERNSRAGIKRSAPMERGRAMAACLKEVAKQGTLICAFRYQTP